MRRATSTCWRSPSANGDPINSVPSSRKRASTSSMSSKKPAAPGSTRSTFRTCSPRTTSISTTRSGRICGSGWTSCCARTRIPGRLDRWTVGQYETFQPSNRAHTFHSMQPESVIIAGAGPIGLACALAAKRRCIDPLVIDAGALANSIVRYPINMTFFTTPERLEIGNHPLVCAGTKATREEALKYYRGVARAEGIRVQTYTKLISAREVATRLGREPISCDKLVLRSEEHTSELQSP